MKYNFGDVNKAAIEPLYWFFEGEKISLSPRQSVRLQGAVGFVGRIE